MIAFLLLQMICTVNLAAAPEPPLPVRPPAVAGQFYPADPGKLGPAVSGFLKDAVKADAPRPIAIIVPHAGYIYSGQISADGFRQAAGYNWDVVVILGTNHTTAGFDKVAVYPKGAFRTPLGPVRIDAEMSARLEAADPDVVFDAAPHAREHSIEVELPFVQHLFPNVPIVAAIVGEADIDLCCRFGAALAETLRGRQALIVASSDLSHYPAYDDAVAADRTTLEAIATLRPEAVQDAVRRQMARSISNLVTCACGEAPILAAMFAARGLGATRATVLSYANSGDAAVGEAERVVGYGAVALTAGSAPSDTRALQRSVAGGKLRPEDKEKLLALARESIRRYLNSETLPLARGFSPAALVNQGAFVTLKEHGELRGCIGTLYPRAPLGRTVGRMALGAAFQDPRFAPVTLDEVPQLEIEISALTPWRTIPDASAIVLGRDGVVIRKSGRSAVFLPQVATEQGWTREEMLDNLCRKAGLGRGSWKQGAELLTFQAEVFSEAQIRRKPK